MRAEHSLRSRLLWALGGVVVLLMAVFAVAIGLFVDVLEDELEARLVRVELLEMPGQATHSHESSTDQAGGLRRWTVPVNDQHELPAPLRRMPEGVREITWDDGLEVFAGKVVVDGRVHAVVADIQNVERLEQRLLSIGVATALLAILLSLLLAVWLSRTALQPISTLVERLRSLDPASPVPLQAPDLQTTEARLIARAVDGYQERIKRLLEREKSLTDDISHELRTPTSVIKTASELLLGDPTVAGVARQRVERIARAARKTGAVVEALLFLGREESEKAAVAVELGGVVRDTVEIYRPVAQAKGIELLAESSSEQWITSPLGTLSIVVQNLVENAIRFTEHGSVRVRVQPGRLIVEDTGVGLAGVDANRIFERGYRSDASQGSGLGLDLARRICDRVGWQVLACPRSTGGTQFEVIFATPTVA